MKSKSTDNENLQTNFCGISLENPTVLASGILGTTPEILDKTVRNGAGAVTTKSIGLAARNGNNNPTLIELEHGLLNAVGLPNPGVEDFIKKFSEYRVRAPIIISIFGGTNRELVEVTKKIGKLSPAMIELNISCPNKDDGMLFGQDPDRAEELVSAVKSEAGSTPLIAKLTPNVTNIAEIAEACEKGGADAICAINTLSGMAINIDVKKPILAYKRGGVSGPAIKPIAVRCVYDIYEKVKIPIIGTGGISTGVDAVEMIMAGASLVGIGSAVHYRGSGVFKKICTELSQWMTEKGYSSIEEMVGLAHEKS